MLTAPAAFRNPEWSPKPDGFGNDVFDMARIPPELATLFEEAGVTQEQLQNPETAEFISKFVEEQGGIDKIVQAQQDKKRDKAALKKNAHEHQL